MSQKLFNAIVAIILLFMGATLYTQNKANLNTIDNVNLLARYSNKHFIDLYNHVIRLNEELKSK